MKLHRTHWYRGFITVLLLIFLLLTIDAVTSQAKSLPSPKALGNTCAVDYVIRNDWGTGATVDVTIHNNSPSAINGWTLTWTFPGNQQITNLWNGTHTQNGQSVSVSNESWNATIPPNGGTVSFGFNLSYSGTNRVPTDFALNGARCSVTPTPTATTTATPTPTPTPTATPTATPAVTVNKTAQEAPGCREYTVTLTVTGNPPPKPVDVILVIDRSGSMGQSIPGDPNTPIYYAKQAALSFAQQILADPNNRVAIASYSDQATLNQSLTNNLTAVQNAINGLSASGYTNIQQGFYIARTHMESNGRNPSTTARAIVLLSDGVANRSGNPPISCSTWPTTHTTCTINAYTEGQTAQSQAVVFAVGLMGAITPTYPASYWVARDTLIQSQNGGYWETLHAADLITIYNQIATQVNPAALNAVATDVVAPGFQIVPNSLSTNYGTAVANGNTITWTLGTVVSQTATLTYRVVALPGYSGTLPTNASAILNYEDVGGDPHQLLFPTPTVNVPPDLVVNAGPDRQIQMGGSVQIGGNPTASGGVPPYTYSWTPSTGLSCTNCPNPTASPAQDTTYTVIVFDSEGCVSDYDSVFVDVLPQVALQKSATPASRPEPGGVFTYTLTITNTSSEAVTITSLTDTHPLSPQCQALINTSLAAGASTSCQYTAVYTQPGTYPNTASVTVKDNEGNPASAQASASVQVTDVTPTPADVEVVKDASPTSVPEPGGVVTFTVQVTNQAVEPLTLTALVDDVHGDLDGRGTCDVPQTLGVGQTYTCYFTATVSGNAGYVETDTVTATLVDDEGNSVSQSDTATVAVAGIRLDKATNRPIAHSGDLVTYTYTVTNPGVTALSIHRMADDRCDSVAFADGDADGDGWLDPDETWVYTCQQVIWDDTTNTAVVEGVDTGGAVVSARDSAFVDVITPTIDVSISAPVTTTAGVLLPYTIVFTNTGDTTLYNVLVTDDRTGFSWTGTLEPGESHTYVVSYTVHTDYIGTVITNTVTAQGTDIIEKTVVDTDAAFTEVIVEEDTPPDHQEQTGDTDGDGIPDYQDTDDDSDGIPDAQEGWGDTDGDGIPDCRDTDSDNDGIPDAAEGDVDTDGDGIPDFRDLDSDDDGIPDAIEGGGDTDGDGIPDFRDLDSDDDGIPDAVEGWGDTDGDGIPDFQDWDSDADTIPDSIEGHGDTDGDGIPDFRDLDSDNDGIPDAVEGWGDTDGDTIPDFRDLDSDNDGIPDAVEGAGDADGDGIPNFRDQDSDGDGIPDRDEYSAGHDDPLCTVNNPVCFNNDVDGDGIPNFLDTDSDGDGKPDRDEGTGDDDGDGIPNWLDREDRRIFQVYLPLVIRMTP